MEFISHPARTVTALDNYMLLIEYCEGTTRLYDVKPLFDKIPIFNKLKENDLFKQVHLLSGGDGIIWNDEIDLASEEPFYNGVIIKSKFDGIMALKDAADLWNLDDSTLRHAIASNRFKCAKDVTKFGKQWVITIEAMVREYGEPKH